MPHSPALCTLVVSLLCPRAALLLELSCIRRVRALQLAGQTHGLRLVPGFQALRCAGAVLATTCIESNKGHEKQNALFHFAQLQRRTCFHSSPSASAIVLSWHWHNYAGGQSCLYLEEIRSRNTRLALLQYTLTDPGPRALTQGKGERISVSGTLTKRGANVNGAQTLPSYWYLT